MAVSPSGHIVSVGLDRNIQIWDVPYGIRSQVMFNSHDSEDDPFPVIAMAVDDEAKWLALVSWRKVMLWNKGRDEWAQSMEVDLGGQKPETVFFNSNKTSPEHNVPCLVVVRRNGTMAELHFEEGKTVEHVVCKTPLIWATSFAEKCKSPLVNRDWNAAHENHCIRSAPMAQLSILTASRKSCIHLVRQVNDSWVSEEVRLSERGSKDIHSLIPVPGTAMYLIGRASTVDLVDLTTSTVVHTFRVEPMQPRSLKQIMSTRNSQAGLASLTLAYVSSHTKNLVIHTYVPEHDGDVIHVSGATPEMLSETWRSTREIKRSISNPGSWEALWNGSIVGVRQKQAARLDLSSSSAIPEPATNGGLRRRGNHNCGETISCNGAEGATAWEVWAIDHLETKGNIETRPLEIPEEEERGFTKLMVYELGPIARLGTASLAVGFGTVIKLVSVGHERFDQCRDRLIAGTLTSLHARRKRGVGMKPRVG